MVYDTFSELLQHPYIKRCDKFKKKFDKNNISFGGAIVGLVVAGFQDIAFRKEKLDYEFHLKKLQNKNKRVP
jgi:hypothetical protein